jgi:cytochrome c oxidase subunit 3
MNLEIGTAETIADDKKKLRGRSILTSGKGSNSGRNPGGGGGGKSGGNGGDGGDNPYNQNLSQVEDEFKPDKYRLVMWFLMLIVLMTFGALISAYIVISTNGVAEWKPFELPNRILNLPYQIWVSTILLLASSATYQISNRKLKRDDQSGSKKWLIATTILGAVFISSQLLAWLELYWRGIYVRSNPYAGFFYILTVIHAVHVLGGISVLGYMLMRTWNETKFELELFRRKTLSNVVGWYWHFMDGLWVVLLLLLAFWK